MAGLDIISYKAANNVAKEERKIRYETLAEGVQGNEANIRDRINKIDQSLDKVVERANKLIINDAINIMKANAKLNAITKTKRYKLHNMIFEDFIDTSGIDQSKSTGYEHLASYGTIRALDNCTIITAIEQTESAPEKAILVVEEHAPHYGIKLNGVNQYIKIPYSSLHAPTQQLRAEIRVKIDWADLATKTSGTEYTHFFCKTHEGGYGLDANIPSTSGVGNVGFSVYINGSYRTAKYPIKNLTPGFHTLTGSFDGQYVRLFVDNVLVSTVDLGGTYTISYKYNNALLIGVDVGTGDQPDTGNYRTYLNGVIDYVKIWNRADGQSGLVGYWEMDEDSGNQVKDMSGNKIHGTLMNGAERVEIESPDEVVHGTYWISRDGGNTWIEIQPEKLMFFDQKSPAGSEMCIKIQLPAGRELHNYGLTWA